MLTVFKYPLALVAQVQTIAFPMGAQILHVDLNPGAQGNLAIWAEVVREPDDRVVKRRFQIVPTGGAVPLGWKHLGTVLDGSFVWHVYMEPMG